MPKKTALPPLAFGNDIAIVHESAQHFSDLIERVFPGLNAYDPLNGRDGFRSKSAVLSLPHSKVVATAISPTYVDRNSNPLLTFMLPFATDAESLCSVDGRRMNWGRGSGMFLPQTDARVIGDGGFRSHIMWQLEKDRLQATALAMLGGQQVDLDLDQARVLPNEISGVRTDATMHAVIPLLELHRKQPEMLANLGVEELIYRQSVMLLRPDLFIHPSAAPSQAEGSPHRSARLLGQLCEYILAHLSEPLTLTDLERISGLSARSLQLAFAAVHGCSPMAWIKEQRLQRVRAELLRKSDDPVEAIALAAGFQTMPSFFLAYKRRFGETPGATKR